MENRREIELKIPDATMMESQKNIDQDNEILSSPPPPSMFKLWKWWLMVTLNAAALIIGQSTATLLQRFYFNQGGNSKWIATLTVSAGFPLTLLLLLFLPSTTTCTTVDVGAPHSSGKITIAAIYIGLGLLAAGDNLMYTYGLLYLPVSTYSLVCATQLAFNVVFSYFLNSQKFTHLILNSVVLLTLSSALLGFHSDPTASVPHENYPLGFALTIGASAAFSLVLSLMQLTFQKVLQREDFLVVLEMQFFTSMVASLTTVVGLFASGEWRGLEGEMEGFAKGKAAYLATLVGTTLSWQVSSLGITGLTFVVSSLFSNVMSTVALPVVPIFAVVFFHDNMGGVKVISMLIALWGFSSYIYQHYLDDQDFKKRKEMNN